MCIYALNKQNIKHYLKYYYYYTTGSCYNIKDLMSKSFKNYEQNCFLYLSDVLINTQCYLAHDATIT